MLNVLADFTKSENFMSKNKETGRVKQSLYVTMKKVKSAWVSVLMCKFSGMVCSSNQHLVAPKR